MKVNFLGIFLIFFIYVFQGNCQSTGVVVSEDSHSPNRIPVSKNKRKYFKIGDKLLGLKSSGEEIFMHKWDLTNMTLAGEYSYNNFPKNFEFESFQELNNQFYLFYSVWNRKENLHKLFAQEIDPNKCSLEGSPKNIITVDEELDYAYRGALKVTPYWACDYENRGHFFYIKKADHNEQLLIQYSKDDLRKVDKKKRRNIGVYVFDNAFKNVMHIDYLIPYEEKKSIPVEYVINQDGTFSMLLAKFKNRTSTPVNHITKSVEYNLEFFLFKDGSSGPVRSEIELEDAHIIDIRSLNTISDTTFIFGQFTSTESDNEYLTYSDGIFSMKIDNQGEVIEKQKYYYKNHLNQDVFDKLGYVRVKSILPQENGGVLVLSEENYDYSPDGGSSSAKTNNIIVSRFEQNGELRWMSGIQKCQSIPYQVGIGAMSFNYVKSNNLHHFFYVVNAKRVENPKMLKEKIQKCYSSQSKGELLHCTIDEAGKKNIEPMFEFNELNGKEILAYWSSNVINISENQIAMEIRSKKDGQFLLKASF